MNRTRIPETKTMCQRLWGLTALLVLSATLAAQEPSKIPTTADDLKAIKAAIDKAAPSTDELKEMARLNDVAVLAEKNAKAKKSEYDDAVKKLGTATTGEKDTKAAFELAKKNREDADDAFGKAQAARLKAETDVDTETKAWKRAIATEVAKDEAQKTAMDKKAAKVEYDDACKATLAAEKKKADAIDLLTKTPVADPKDKTEKLGVETQKKRLYEEATMLLATVTGDEARLKGEVTTTAEKARDEREAWALFKKTLDDRWQAVQVAQSRLIVTLAADNQTLKARLDEVEKQLKGKADKGELTGLARTSDFKDVARKGDLTGLATKTEVAALAVRVKAVEEDLPKLVRKGDLEAVKLRLKTVEDTLPSLATKTEVEAYVSKLKMVEGDLKAMRETLGELPIGGKDQAKSLAELLNRLQTQIVSKAGTDEVAELRTLAEKTAKAVTVPDGATYRVYARKQNVLRCGVIYEETTFVYEPIK